MRMRRAILPSAQFYSILQHYLIYGTIIEFPPHHLSATFLILRKVHNTLSQCTRLHVPYRYCIVGRFEWKLNSLYKFLKKTLKYLIPPKCTPWQHSCSMRTDWRTDRQTRQSKQSLIANFRTILQTVAIKSLHKAAQSSTHNYTATRSVASYGIKAIQLCATTFSSLYTV